MLGTVQRHSTVMGTIVRALTNVLVGHMGLDLNVGPL